MECAFEGVLGEHAWEEFGSSRWKSSSGDVSTDMCALPAMAEIAYEAAAPRTLYDKIWADHVVEESEDGTALIFIDRHLVHEVSGPPEPLAISS